MKIHVQEPPTPAEETYITCKELAVILRLSKVTVYRLVNAGQVQGTIRVGRSLRIPASGAAKSLQDARTPSVGSSAETAEARPGQ